MNDNSPSKAYNFINMVKKSLKEQCKSAASIKKLDSLIKYCANQAFCEKLFTPGEELYRARIYRESDAPEKYRYQIMGAFNGYDKNGSFINPDSRSVPEGRCNYKAVQCLYTATSEKICISEVRPKVNEYVSMAIIQVLEPLRILYFQSNSMFGSCEQPIISGVLNTTLGLYMAREFSMPFSNEGDYRFCQYISEQIKALDFDGIAYTSAACPNCGDDCNVVIFKYEKCKPISSKLYKINSMTDSEYNFI